MAFSQTDIVRLLKFLQRQGWLVRHAEEALQLPPFILERYKSTPRDFQLFISMVADCESANRQCWFLTAYEYGGSLRSALTWDAFERQSLAAAEGDGESSKEIEAFWRSNLPFFISVRDGFAFLSLDEDGAVWFGREPEYESTLFVSDSFADFVEQAIARALPPSVSSTCML